MQSLILQQSQTGKGNSLGVVIVADPSQNAITGFLNDADTWVSLPFDTTLNIPYGYDVVGVVINGSNLSRAITTTPEENEYYINEDNQIVLNDNIPVDSVVRVQVKLSQQLHLISTQTITDTTTGNTTSIVLSAAESPINIIINNQIFAVSNSESIPVGAYYYNHKKRTVTINTSGISNGSVIAMRTMITRKIVPNNLIKSNVPYIISQYAIDNINLSCSVEGHPTLSEISLVVPKNQLNSLLSQLPVGRYIPFFGYALMIGKQPSVTFLRRSDQCMVTVSFKGYHEELAGFRNNLDKPIKLTDIAPSITLHSLGARVGKIITGKNPKIIIDKNPDKNSTTTVRNEIQARAITKLAFVDWSSQYINIQGYYDSPIHILNEDDVYGTDDKDGSILHYEFNGSGAIVDGINLVKEYHNTILQTDNKDSTEGEGDEILTLITQDIDAHISPNIPKESLRLPSMAWDNGGITRTRVFVKTINGETVGEIEEIYGVLATSLDTYITRLDTATDEGYVIAPRNLDFDTLWQLCSYKITTYLYDNNNHLIGTKVKGNYKSRFKTESDEKELSQIYGRHLIGEITEAERNLLAEPYLFKDVPIVESQENSLALFSEYYQDIPENEDEQSKFVKESIKSVNNFFEMSDPESTEEEPKPPLKTGNISTEKQTITIVSTRQPKIYLESNLNTNNSGEQLKDSASFVQSSQVAGTPSTANKLKLYGRAFKEPDPTVEEDSKVYRISTPNALDIDNSEIVSFPDVTRISEALRCAECQISMENSKEALKLTINLTRLKTQIKPGHRVYFNGRLWWVLNVAIDTHSTKGKMYFNKFELQLGNWFDLQLSLSV